jgi:hypothetical protein
LVFCCIYTIFATGNDNLIMKLHIFNPEHDIALASNLENFTAPHAGRQLRGDLGWIPAIWADADDVVLVDDIDYAEKALKKFCANSKMKINCQFVNQYQLEQFCFDSIEPWGWDCAIRHFLLRWGASDESVPSLEAVENIRRLSHRRMASEVLKELRTFGTTGESYCCAAEEAQTMIRRFGHAVLKAPWSSSGRGIRYVDSELTFQQQGWLRNVVNSQGAVMVEPYYNKVKDFAVELVSDGKGRVECLGLSLFHTLNGAYTGNLLATETAKRELLAKYISIELLDHVITELCTCLGKRLAGLYSGPLGVDMMIVSDGDGKPCLLHPCVEINMRRTMGHVALSLSPDSDDVKKVMRITMTDNYKLKINKL